MSYTARAIKIPVGRHEKSDMKGERTAAQASDPLISMLGNANRGESGGKGTYFTPIPRSIGIEPSGYFKWICVGVQTWPRDTLMESC